VTGMAKERIYMKIITLIQERAKSIVRAAVRFPLVIIFLIIIAALLSIQIESDQSRDFLKEILPLMVGLFLSASVQVYLEKRKKPLSVFLISQGAVLALTALLYFLNVFNQENGGLMDGLRAFITSFILVIVFLWIPSIRWKANFNDVFMSAFKGFFTAGFFTFILWGGLSLVLAAVNSLLFELPSNTFGHMAIWIWLIVAPIQVLALTPIFDGSEEEIEHADKQSKCPAFLRVLLSFVLIPLTILYTIVLLAYLLKTIVSGDTQNLLEPLILSYSIVVILLYVLSSEIDNKISSMYLLVFPKIMALIALYQVVISLGKMTQEGVTYGRYFVILFGIFSVVIGILMSFLPKSRNHILAIVLTGFAIVSILPPVDVFTVSINSQTNILQQVLEDNDMIVDGAIVPNESISEKDQGIITRAVESLRDMNRLTQIDGIPDTFQFYRDFKGTFGFDPYYQNIVPFEGKSSYFSLDYEQALEVEGYDYFLTMNGYDQQNASRSISIEATNGKTYTCELVGGKDKIDIVISDADGMELLTASISDKIDALVEAEVSGGEEKMMSPEQMTIQLEDKGVSMRIILRYAGKSTYNSDTTYDTDMFILLRFA
jgi:hypothetical protein